MTETVFLLHSNCRIVKGYRRSIICDLQLRKLYPVPNSLGDLFIEGRALYYDAIEAGLQEDEKQIIRDYLRFLTDHELGIFCTIMESALFPDLSLDWDYPASITNCIIDAGHEIEFFDRDFVSQLDALGCYYIQMRFYGSPAIGHLSRLLSVIKTSEVQSVELVLKSTEEEQYVEEVLRLRDDHVKIRSVILHSHTDNTTLRDFIDNRGLVVAIKEAVSSEKCCGIVDQDLFQSNIPLFTESLAHNTCLNRKISIDKDGHIKNCPSMAESFGNIRDTTLEDALHKPGFKKYWNITKDRVAKCKDCEFRRVCTDCRAYLEDPDDIYSAPLKCGYDPYTCKWDEWSTNPLKQKTIAYYGLPEWREG